MMPPLVSVVLCTRDRAGFLKHAIAAYFSQAYENKELIVVDGSDVPSVLLAPMAESIYLHAPAIPLGDARNVACECAAGDVVVLWDDDDLHAPDRLASQVEYLTKTRARLVGLSRRLYFDAAAGVAYERNVAPILDGGTLAFYRDLWRRHPFTAGAFLCEQEFVRAHRASMLDLAGIEAPYVVAALHDGNRANKDFASPSWRRASLDEVPIYARLAA